MFQEPQAKLKETQVAPVRAMNQRQEVALPCLIAQIDNPDISQASGNHQFCQALRISEMAFVQMKAAAFLIGEEGLNAETLLIPFCSFAKNWR